MVVADRKFGCGRSDIFGSAHLIERMGVIILESPIVDRSAVQRDLATVNVMLLNRMSEAVQSVALRVDWVHAS